MSEFEPLDEIFHAGERAIQARSERGRAVEAFSRRAIRPSMPEQHRSFFRQLPFLVVGSVDRNGWPWASMVAGNPGFISTPNPTELTVGAAPLQQDPLTQNIATNQPVGLLGIELSTRRRNRMNGRISANGPGGFSVSVDLSFGNCPRYIQTRDVKFIRDPAAKSARTSARQFTTLDAQARAAIAQSNSFFVASQAPTQNDPITQGVDVSHRGGQSGFVRVEGDTLTVPDYSGNFLFNTLGNFLLNPKAGLIFPNYDTGDLLMLTGLVEILWEDHPEVLAFDGAERAWKFTLDQGVLFEDGLPFRAEFDEYSPNSLMTGNWPDTEARLKAR